ncbi:PLP-dependent transferase [Infundibulicybe gibba]|nr:PLP-dependent transferase [Infundibulicybe gibba]
MLGNENEPEAEVFNATGAHSNRVTVLPSTFYDQFLSDVAKVRKPSPIHSLFHLEATPGLISFLAGKPNASTFPFTSLSVSARSPMDPTKETSLKIEESDFAQGLQYGETAGWEKLCDWFYGLQEFSHGRKRNEGWKISVGTGSQDVIFKAMTALLNPGDSVLVESPAYSEAIAIFRSLHCGQIEVETDSCGISTTFLRSILQNWPPGKPKPKLLYTVPYGCNPTGVTATLERRKEVLRLAKEYNFLILEDDPYYYLYYGDPPRYPSYFTLELQESEVGRVLRFDSLSKILSAGIRIGFASGPEAILQAIDGHTSVSNLQTSSLTQVITFSLLNSWGYDGFKIHTERVAAFYREKRDAFEHAMTEHLSGLAEWTAPEAGMFFWFKLLLSDRPDAEDGDSENIIRNKAFERGVLALPGTVFLPNGRKSAYVRAAFSLASAEDIEEAVKRIRDTILDARAATPRAQ